jgi:hypothetical protein
MDSHVSRTRRSVVQFTILKYQCSDFLSMTMEHQVIDELRGPKPGIAGCFQSWTEWEHCCANARRRLDQSFLKRVGH